MGLIWRPSAGEGGQECLEGLTLTTGTAGKDRSPGWELGEQGGVQLSGCRAGLGMVPVWTGGSCES